MLKNSFWSQGGNSVRGNYLKTTKHHIKTILSSHKNKKPPNSHCPTCSPSSPSSLRIDFHHKGPRSRSQLIFVFSSPICSTHSFIGACRQVEALSFPPRQKKTTSEHSQILSPCYCIDRLACTY